MQQKNIDNKFTAVR